MKKAKSTGVILAEEVNGAARTIVGEVIGGINSTIGEILGMTRPRSQREKDREALRKLLQQTR